MFGNVTGRARVFGSPAATLLRHAPNTRSSTLTLLQRQPLSNLSSPSTNVRISLSSRPNYDAAVSVRWAHIASRVRFDARPHTSRILKSLYSTKPESKPSPPTGKDSVGANIQTPSEGKHRSLYDRLPHLPQYHRPTREELLAAATGFWSRLKVRFKWFSIRSARPFNSDEIGALFSWVLLGNLLWIILGTTTFASLVIFLFNTIVAQETLARWVGNYLTKSSGVKIVFESAIVPKWRGGVISFRNIYLSRRPGSKARVSKGSPETAAAAAAAFDHSPAVDEDTNYTQCDLTLDEVNVTLSFRKWFNGQGMLSDVEIKGVRGVIDRTNVHFTGEHVDPKSYRHEHNPGDFEIDSFRMDDFLVTVYQPGDFRPFTVSIFSCDLPKLRQRWLFYDFLCANNVSGSFDDSLFTIHPRQMHRPANQRASLRNDSESESVWQRQSRLRIDALKIDHLNRGTEGPFSWIHEGTVDLIADVMFPAETDDGLIAMFLSEVKNTRLARSKQGHDVAQNGLAETIETFMAAPSALDSVSKGGNDRRLLVMDLRVNFHDVRAAVPLLTRDLSYVNNALIRPIVGYINSRNTFIPINCRLAKRITDFDGSWTLYDSGLLDDLSAESYNAIVRDITDHQATMRRFKKVGLWSLQLAVQALFMGMAGVIA